ncbi:uncharacterized protein LOC113293573 isoform X1 [Papaver somniferum]|uniref:uncharacterized protein LOC113293573 isoform X1 n=2 Tax=Papaver somniferum TaxID=3469 RepID=UPI000E70489B|nr:uncharacterized protein LOC113293573 isoform X1 [Papaver somniferum]
MRIGLRSRLRRSLLLEVKEYGGEPSVGLAEGLPPLESQVPPTAPPEGSGSALGVHTSFTISGPICDSLGALTSVEFGSYTDEKMLVAVPQYADMSCTFDTVVMNRVKLDAALWRSQVKQYEAMRQQLQQEKERSYDLELKLIAAQAEVTSIDLDAASEYRLIKKKWDIEKDYVKNLLQRISNKYGKIDHQEDEIRQLREELKRYHRFEYVPEEMDNLRARLGELQRLVSDKTLLDDNLESQCHSLRLQNRDLHVDRRRILTEKTVAERQSQEASLKVRDFEKLSQDLEWTQAQFSALQAAHNRQRAEWNDHKKYCPTNKFNEQAYNEMTSRLSKAEDELANSVESLKIVLPTLSAEQGRVYEMK